MPELAALRALGRRFHLTTALPVAVLAGVFVCLAIAAQAIPYVPDKTLGPAGFPRGSTITVYIPKDPLEGDATTPRNRVPALEAGVKQWADPLKKLANIDLKIVKLDANGKDPATGMAPDYTMAGTVEVRWDTDTAFENAGHKGSAAYATHASIRTDRQNVGGKIRRTNPRLTTGGQVHMRAASQGIEAKDNDDATRNGIHELGHVLGLTHSKKANTAMNGDLMGQPFPGEVTEADKIELGAVYGLSAAQVKATITPRRDPGTGKTSYLYRYELENVSDEEIALFQVALDDPDDVFDLVVPDGWVSFFAETLAPDEDVDESPLPDIPGTVLTFRADILNDDVPYLGPSNPVLEFGFSSFIPPAQDLGWSGALVDLPAPVLVDAPPVSALFGLTLVTLIGIRRRRLRPNAAGATNP